MKVRETIEKVKVLGQKAIIPYMVFGFPDIRKSIELLFAFQDHGATAVEVGIPFTDPVADGPVIQKAHARALENGVNPGMILESLKEIKGQVKIPLILMTYYNPVFRMGELEFAQRAIKAGVAGVIIPDLPPEEAEGWLEAARSSGLETIFLVAPNTPVERVKRIAGVTSGFLYCLSLKGVTGSRIKALESLRERVKAIRQMVDLPVCVGFGIREPWEVRTLLEVSDGVIIGSSLLEALERGQETMLELFDQLKAPCQGLVP